MSSRWYAEAVAVIRSVLLTLPANASRYEARQAIRAAYPFGQREYHPYRMWCRAVRDELKRHFASRTASTVAQPQIRVHPRTGVICLWCDSLGPKRKLIGCLACVCVRDRFDRLSPEVRARWLAWLKAARQPPVEVGMNEEADALRQFGLLPRKHDVARRKE